MPNPPRRSPRLHHRLLAAALLLPCILPLQADEPASDTVAIRGDYSGHWFDPQQPGYGLQIEVLDGNRAALTWYAFDPSGRPLWLYGVLQVQSDEAGARLSGELATAQGGGFPPHHDGAAVEYAPWGNVVFTPIGCDAATVQFDALDPAFGAHALSLQRLTAISGQRCNAEEQFAEQRTFAFERGLNGFEVLFADLPRNGQDIYELDFAHETLPAPLAGHRGLRLTGHNRSDDLAMLIKAALGGLLPDTVYQLEIEAEVASNVPTGCAGIGGSPGDSVYLKLGASTIEPLAVSVTEGDTVMKRLNIDFGNQAEGGAQAPVVGTLANTYTCDDGVESPWQLRTLDTRQATLRVRSDADGTIWVFAGSDSGFEGLTSYFITRLTVRLDPRPEA